MSYQLFSIIGLLLDIIGAITLSYGLIISKERACELGVSRACGITTEENTKLPVVSDRLRQSKHAVIGLILLSIGFLLQIIGLLQTI